MDYKEFVKESKVEDDLKKFFRSMIDITGYEYTLVSTTEDSEVKTSLEGLTSSLDGYSNEELTLALMKAAVISADTPIPFVNEMIKNKEYEELNQMINSSLIARRAVTHEFMMSCYTDNEQLVANRRDRKAALKRIKMFKSYVDGLGKDKPKTLLKENSSRI